MALQDSVRISLEQRLQWLKNYIATIKAAIEELPAHEAEILEIETALQDADEGKGATVAVAKREKAVVDSPDKLSQENADGESKAAEAAKP